MGGSSKQTVGYRYRYALQWGLTFGPCDAFLRWVAGGREAWRGRVTESSAFTVSAPELWGGDSKEGGVDGTLTINMGGPTQAPDAGLAETMGHAQPAYRGKLTAWFKGVFGAMNPYPKESEFLVERILSGWEGDECWYPEKAKILVKGASAPAAVDDNWRYKVETTPSNDYSAPTFDDSSWAEAPGGFGSSAPPGSTLPVGTFVSSGLAGRTIWIRRKIRTSPTEITLQIYHDDGAWAWWNGAPLDISPTANYYHGTAIIPAGSVINGDNTLVVKVVDAVPGGSPTEIFAGVAFSAASIDDTLWAMNPAHMLYDSITDARERGGQGEPRGAINDLSFRAAADTLFSEGFGLCTIQGESESAEEFQERILNIIGGSLTQSRVTGEYYLDLIRSDYSLEDLPSVTDDDILDIDVETVTPLEMVNRVQVQWLDIDENQSRVTSPVTSLGLVQSVGGVIPKTYDHREIPREELALRIAQRYLTAQPSSKYSLKVNRKLYALRKGQYFRLQSDREGLTDIVCVVGEIDYGEFDKGAISVKALPDVFGLPTASFSAPATAVGSGESEPAAPSPNVIALELPYVEVVSTVTPERLATLASDVGYFGLVAQRPSSDAINFGLSTAAASAPFVDVGQRDWCPHGELAAAIGISDTALTLASIVDPARVRLGSWALLDAELVRIDAVDGLTITVGRGCGDSVPTSHDAATVLWFAGDWIASDAIEYVGGDVISGRVQTRSPGSVLPIELAPVATAPMDDRFARPYPPGQIRINGESEPGAIVGAITVTGVHRDRLLQADQLIDTEMAAVGPEAGTTYTVRYILNGTLVHTDSGLTSCASTYTPAGVGQVRVEIESVRDTLTSFQMHVREFAVGLVLQAESGAPITTEDGQVITME